MGSLLIVKPLERKYTMPDTHLTTEQLNYFKSRLVEMEKKIKMELSKETPDNPQEALNELADFQNHPADQGTEQFDQELDKGLTMMTKDKLTDINDALEKIEQGTYGLSEKSKKPIPIERLKAEPTARNLVDEE